MVASALPQDGFSRGSEVPVVLSDSSLFFRGATESLCTTVAEAVVDGGATTRYKGTAADAALIDMVHNVMSVAVNDPREPELLAILREHFESALAQSGKATDALRSAFVLACTAPSTVAIGL